MNFKGAVQKVFITAFETELSPENDIWRGVASTRTLFAAPGAGYNPLTVDEEVVTALKKTDTGVRGRLRLLGFLCLEKKRCSAAQAAGSPNLPCHHDKTG